MIIIISDTFRWDYVRFNGVNKRIKTPNLDALAEDSVNFNNCYSCGGGSTVIDALVHPINPIIGGLLQAYPGFQTSDVWIYDATIGGRPPVSKRQVPQVFTQEAEIVTVGLGSVEGVGELGQDAPEFVDLFCQRMLAKTPARWLANWQWKCFYRSKGLHPA